MIDARQAFDDNRTKLISCLQQLSHGRGMWRGDDDLVALLQGKLGELTRCWDIDVNAGAEKARARVMAMLDEIIRKLPPPSGSNRGLNAEERESQYRTVIFGSFNIAGPVAFQQMNLDRRQDSLARRNKVSARTIRRDLKDAIEQIADILASDEYRPASLDEVTESARPSSIAASPSAALKRRPWWRSRRVVIVTLSVTLAVLAGLIVAVVTTRDHPDASAPQSSQKDLQATVLDVSDGGSGWSVAFSTDRPDAIKTFVDRAESGEPIGPFFGQGGDRHFLSDALDAGGYVLGQVLIQVELEGTADRQVTVYNIRIVPVGPRAPVATGAAVLFPPGAGPEPRRVAFDLDQAHPIAKTVPRDGVSPGPFFESEIIDVPKGGKETLLLQVDARAYAYAFKVAIDYEIGGEKGSRLVTRTGLVDGPPFRVTGSLCPAGKEGLPADERARLQTASYASLRNLDAGGAEPRFVAISHATYSQDCYF